jgi:hypothetical protein
VEAGLLGRLGTVAGRSQGNGRLARATLTSSRTPTARVHRRRSSRLGSPLRERARPAAQQH